MEEICPNCGNWFNRLNPTSGFCEDCTEGLRPLYPLYTRVESYLAANADEIEHYLLKGKSLNAAIDLLHGNNGRPNCLSCGSVIRRARRTSIFCRRTPQCRRFSRRYVYLYTNKGMSKSEALATVLGELT